MHTNHEGIKESKDHRNSEDPIELMDSHFRDLAE